MILFPLVFLSEPMSKNLYWLDLTMYEDSPE